MKFGEYRVAGAEGLMLAHSINLPGLILRKGHRITPADVKAFQHAGISTVSAAQVEDCDLTEDEAAAKLARLLREDHLRLSEAATGRVNIFAAVNGVFVAERSTIDRFNRIDPAITMACLSDHVQVRSGDMVATIKIIPLAVPACKVEAACQVLTSSIAFAVKPFHAYEVSLIATQLPSLKSSTMEKTSRVLERRLAASGSRLLREHRVAHRPEAVAAAISGALSGVSCSRRLIVIFGASAVIDPEDVIPAAIRSAGGEVLSVGMPVDPGNLLVLGRIDQTYIIGAPGCARSPKENGFDWVLDRILAGEELSAHDLTGMGVGGLLMEIETRPRPRDNQRLETGS
jgi:molybdenum cofactor cytidylyltransferase